jgi:hypothetical protein
MPEEKKTEIQVVNAVVPAVIEMGRDSFFWEHFDRYCKWLSLPRHFAGKLDADLMGLGFDEETIALLRIPSKKAFAESCNMPYTVLKTWDVDPKAEVAVKDHWRRWAKQKTPNVVGKLYEKIMADGEASHIKIWQGFVEQQADKLDIEAGISRVYDNMKADEAKTKEGK